MADKAPKVVREVPLHAQGEWDEAPAGRTPGELLEMVWQLTVDAWAFKGEPVGESRLPRHIVRVQRGRG